MMEETEINKPVVRFGFMKPGQMIDGIDMCIGQDVDLGTVFQVLVEEKDGSYTLVNITPSGMRKDFPNMPKEFVETFTKNATYKRVIFIKKFKEDQKKQTEAMEAEMNKRGY